VRTLVIVAIDDDAAYCEMLDDFLTSEGHEVRIWHEAAGANEMIREWQPDLILLDLWLERGRNGGVPSGWGVFQEVRLHPSTAQIPVIVCSADVPTLDGYRETLQDDDTVSFLEKPFDLEDLGSQIRVVTGVSAVERE
jgi:CheY-like chemotaxis protein